MTLYGKSFHGLPAAAASLLPAEVLTPANWIVKVACDLFAI
jgi:hypothetical protein